MIDIHCHLLPYVDDGANDLEEALRLLTLEAAQGVTEACATPHLRLGMFETPDEKLLAQYERLKGPAAEKGLRLFLSREYHCDELLFDRLRDRTLLPIGDRTLLVEFSQRHSGEQLRKAVGQIQSGGYVPLIAHMERYPAATESLIRTLREEGALIQVNADAVLGYDGRALRRFAWTLLKAGLVDVIASDAHSVEERPPRMRACSELLRKKLGDAQAEKLLHGNPASLLSGLRRQTETV
ncbi:MAG: capsular biosynthesis protein [Oscillospiraceae bacterium]|nr:capsular biosynthesis protein [Oscillospiraceae bacterium]